MYSPDVIYTHTCKHTLPMWPPNNTVHICTLYMYVNMYVLMVYMYSEGMLYKVLLECCFSLCVYVCMYVCTCTRCTNREARRKETEWLTGKALQENQMYTNIGWSFSVVLLPGIIHVHVGVESNELVMLQIPHIDVVWYRYYTCYW